MKFLENVEKINNLEFEEVFQKLEFLNVIDSDINSGMQVH